ncbi:MAG: Rnase Y domain-containing protein [Lentimicrobiaceae bacterium]|nr:Rnase Y domain-containing protein [Lentimicrobiaceae bacterium]
MESLIIIIVAFIAGIAAGWLISSTILKNAILKKSALLLKDAEEKGEMIKKEKVLEAKEKFIQLKAEQENHFQEKNKELLRSENRIKQKEASLSQKHEELQRKQKETNSIRDNLTNQMEIINRRQSELEKTMKQQVEKLEVISGLSAEQAKAQLIDALKEEARAEAMVHAKDIVEEAKLTATM